MDIGINGIAIEDAAINILEKTIRPVGDAIRLKSTGHVALRRSLAGVAEHSLVAIASRPTCPPFFGAVTIAFVANRRTGKTIDEQKGLAIVQRDVVGKVVHSELGVRCKGVHRMRTSVRMLVCVVDDGAVLTANLVGFPTDGVSFGAELHLLLVLMPGAHFKWGIFVGFKGCSEVTEVTRVVLA